ncbi:MAG: exodeoxyribonuclease VII small subunit [Firmicutes bacterium]|nr:exodeoxyribonuclease VII small subunit [Bacillota bacterium]MCL2255683.1 exodeoxyribonuclease VII small subunit [Bacillota bacterium]
MEFEKNLNELEKLVAKMQDKNISLNDGIALYEKGITLTRKALDDLGSSRSKIVLLKAEMDKLVEEPFNGEI